MLHVWGTLLWDIKINGKYAQVSNYDSVHGMYHIDI